MLMKSKIYTLTFLFIALLGIKAMAQQPSNWTESLYNEDLTSIIERESTIVNEGNYSVKYTFTDDGVPYFICDTFAVTGDAGFTFDFDFYVPDDKSEITTRIFFFEDDGTQITKLTSSGLTNNPSWQTITQTGTVPTDATKAYVVIRMLDGAGWDGTATFYADKASYTEGGSNLIVNGGFEDWDAPVIPVGSTVDNWVESLYNEDKTSTIESEQTIVNDGFTSLKYTFTDDGTPYFICDTFEVTADATFNFDFDFYVLDDKSEMTTRIYFFEENGTYISKMTSSGLTNNPSWQTINQTGTVPSNAAKAYVLIRMLTGASWDGSATYYADNAVYTENGGTSNMIVNGSFENWTGEQLSDKNDILSFKFAALNPIVTANLNYVDFTITAEVPYSTDVTSLVPTIEISEGATISPDSGVATDFTNPVTYTVTAEDESTQDWVVTVTKAAEGQTVLFFEDFEDIQLIPSDWTLINNDPYTMAEGEERWQDSAWVVTTSGRDELIGSQIALASSYTTDMPETGSVDDWMILPAISIGENSTLSWQAMSTTTSGDYPDDYMVLIAPAISGADPTISYFESDGNILLEVEPESWSASVSNPGEGKMDRSVNLKEEGWTDQDVWIAFRLTTDLYTNPTTGEPNSNAGGYNLAVDNIKVVNDVSTGFNRLDKETFDARLFPNPTDGDFRIVFNSDIQSTAQIEIFDITGRVVFDIQEEVKVGKNELELNVSDYNTGIYLISTNINNKVNVSKLIVK